MECKNKGGGGSFKVIEWVYKIFDLEDFNNKVQ